MVDLESASRLLVDTEESMLFESAAEETKKRNMAQQEQAGGPSGITEDRDAGAGDQPEEGESGRPSQRRKLDLASNPMVIVQEQLDSLRDYHTHNDFEKAVVSGCRSGVTLIREFSLSAQGKAVYDRVFDRAFFQTWNEEFKISKGKYPANNKSYSVGNTFEIDLYAILREPVNLSDFLREIYQADQSNVFPLWPEEADLAQITVEKGESIYLEITEPVRDVPVKLFQLERTLQLKDSCIGAVDTKTAAAAVVVNGNKRDVSTAVAALRATHKRRVESQGGVVRKLDEIPTFIIYSPFRNVYSELSDIKKMLSDELPGMKIQLDELPGMQKQLVSLDAKLMWSLMDVDELRAECTAKRLSLPSTTLTKSALVRLLSTTLS